jgi:cell division protein FtsW
VNGRARTAAYAPRRSSLAGEARNVRRHKPDYWLLILTALFLTLGLVIVYSISPALAASQHISQNYFITKQLIAVVLGLVTFAVAASLSLGWWLKAAKPLAIAALIGCLVVMVTPINAQYPAHRWIRAGGFSFQVAELIKLALLVYLANFIGRAWKRGRISDSRAVLQPIIILLLVLGVVVAKLQSDLGSTGVMIIMIGAMAFTAGVPLKKIALISGLVVLLVALAISTSSYRRDRLTTFLHPERNCQTTGYQECQALISVGSGGLLGLGLGYSVQAYGYLPEASNDSIFAIIAEKFGFIGTIGILVLYGAFITRLRMIIERTADPISRLIVVGVMAWLSTQMLINVGAMVGLLPLKGITLPLISQGGTSLIFLTAALGLVFQISRYTNYKITEPELDLNEENRSSNRIDGGRVRRPHSPSIVTRPRT